MKSESIKTTRNVTVSITPEMFTEEECLAFVMAHSNGGNAPYSISLSPRAEWNEFIIGIGKDHTATLLIDKDAMSALSELLEKQKVPQEGQIICRKIY